MGGVLSPPLKAIMHYTDLDTAALILDLDVTDKNIHDMQEACDVVGIGLRVHTKTHKTPEIARIQVEAGAIGIVSQKLGEAEAMVAGGLKDILIPYNIVGKTKLERLGRLVNESDAAITVAADSTTTVQGLSRQATNDGCTIRVVVEMDTGAHRCGAQSPQETIELAKLVDDLPGLEFSGVMTHPSWEKARDFITEVKDLTDKAGLPTGIVSGGGTGTQVVAKAIGCTENRMGSYLYEGTTRVSGQKDLHPNRCPLRVAVTVVSTNAPGQVIVDAGRKSFSTDPPMPYGRCVEDPQVFIKGLSAEHGHIDATGSSRSFKVGDVLSFIPNHGGMTTNLYDRMHPVRNGEVLDTWAVAGRGRAF